MPINRDPEIRKETPDITKDTREVVSVFWFTHVFSCIGIVIAKDTITGERKAYMGVGKGICEKADIFSILDWGAKVPLEFLENILEELK